MKPYYSDEQVELHDHQARAPRRAGSRMMSDTPHTPDVLVSSVSPVLDVTCGTRAMWFDKRDPRAIMCDQRAEAITVTDRTRGRQDGTRTLTIDPDIQCDFRELPFRDATFRLVVFDPPHLVRAGQRSWLAARYGRLGASWRDDLRQGFAECFRVLMPGGVLIFKWSEVQVPLRDVLALTPERPLFGHPTGARGSTHWVAFIAPEPLTDLGDTSAVACPLQPDLFGGEL